MAEERKERERGQKEQKQPDRYDEHFVIEDTPENVARSLRLKVIPPKVEKGN